MFPNIKLSDVAREVGGILVGQDCVILDVSTDSRDDLAGKLFVALVGERFNGHEFVASALENGACAVLVSEPRSEQPRIEVPDTAEAYAKVGRMARRLFANPVIAITGSNGKTSVKDWLASVLSLKSNVLKTQSNLNNQIGVPKTLLGLNAQYDFAVIEAGTSYPGEIEKLGQTIEADVVILTNASGSHLLGFGSIQGIAIEKGKLFETARKDAVVVLNADDASFSYWLERLCGRVCLSFSFSSSEATLWAKQIDESIQGSKTILVYQGKEYLLSLDRPGKHHVANAMAVALAMTALGFSFDEIVKRLQHPAQVPGRMELLQGRNEAVIINDCYNASPKSVEAAMDVLALYREHKKWMILGALGELGSQEESIHFSLGDYAARVGVDCLVTIGSIAAYAANGFEQAAQTNQSVYRCANKEEATDLLASLNSNHVILVKGSRSAKMEDIVNAIRN